MRSSRARGKGRRGPRGRRPAVAGLAAALMVLVALAGAQAQAPSPVGSGGGQGNSSEPLSAAESPANGAPTADEVAEDDSPANEYVVECEIELTYRASGINLPKFDATFAIRNNRQSELSAWQVVWRYAAEKLIPGSVDGAILLATGTSSGQPARVVNTRTNAPIPPFSTKGFTFMAYSTVGEGQPANISRAPDSVSVNGLSCAAINSLVDVEARENSGDAVPANEDCIPPQETNGTESTFLPSCIRSYCCGLLSLGDTGQEDLQKSKARKSLLPPQIIEEKDDIAWSDCSVNSTVVLVQNASMEPIQSSTIQQGEKPLIAALVEPGGYFGLCANTTVGPLFGEDFFDFYLLTNDNQAVSLSAILGVSQDGLLPKTRLQALIEAEEPLYAVTDLNQDTWKHVTMDLNDLGVPGWAFFGIRNNEASAAIPIMLYDMGLYASVDKAVAQAIPPPTLNWGFLEQNANLTAITTLFETPKEEPKEGAIIPALLCSIFAVLFIMVVAIGSSCILRRRQIQKGKFTQADRARDWIGDIQGLKDAIVRRYERKSSLKLDEASVGGIFDIDFKTEINLQEIIGSGGFGSVHKAVWKGESVAVKIMHGMVEGSQMLETFKKEIFLLSRLKHPGIVNFLGASLKPPDVCIVQELAEGGSLYTLLHGAGAENKPMKYVDILQYGLDIADAMAYLHPTVVHRDLKSQNVLLDANRRAKVCDFGIAKFKDKTLLTTVNSQAGTPAYMAPELFAAGDVSEKVDVFSYGVLLWECFTGCVPWDELSTPMQVIFAVGVQKQRLPVPPHCPTFLARLMADCWRENPQDRPSFATISNWIEEEYEKYVAKKSLMLAENSL